MNINSVGSTSSTIGGTLQSGGSTSGRVDRDGDNDGGKQTRGGRSGGGQVLNAVAQTLSQLGIGSLSPVAAPPVAAAQTTRGNNDSESAATSNGQGVGQALYGFMNSLFQAIGPAGQGGSAQAPARPPSPPPSALAPPSAPPSTLAASASKGYGDLGSRLQNLVQSLSSGSGSAPTAATEKLNTAFQNLTQALKARDGGGDNATSGADLQSFLKTLVQNLQGTSGSALAGVGNVINTTA